MEQKMKRIPFDLDLAKQGVAFRVSEHDISDNYHVLSNEQIITFQYKQGGDTYYSTLELGTELGEAYHLIPDEPKPERWVILPARAIEYTSKNAALDASALLQEPFLKIVKLAD